MERASAAVPAGVVEGIDWPAIGLPDSSMMLAMQWQLDGSQWWPAESILEHQFRQLRELAAHATANVPYYESHLLRAGLASAEELTPDSFRKWPLLSSAEARQSEAALTASTYPKEHGPRVSKQSVVGHFYVKALALREHLWRGRDLGAKLAAVSVAPAVANDWWGAATTAAFRTGPRVYNDGLGDAKAQLDWLAAQNPAYLMTTPGSLEALVEQSLRTGKMPPGVREVITMTQPVPAELRPQLARAWQARLVDAYSHDALGPIALRCPTHENHHVQAENLYVEVLHEDGTPCQAGEVGAVVVTALHDFAMPLLRYDTGDLAELGNPCPCGRGLPVLRRIASLPER